MSVDVNWKRERSDEFHSDWFSVSILFARMTVFVLHISQMLICITKEEITRRHGGSQVLYLLLDWLSGIHETEKKKKTKKKTIKGWREVEAIVVDEKTLTVKWKLSLYGLLINICVHALVFLSWYAIFNLGYLLALVLGLQKRIKAV